MTTSKEKPVKGTTGIRPSRVVLGEVLDIDGVVRLHRRLLKCADRKNRVTINAAKVSRADTASLQALLAFVERICADGNRISWQSPSDALVRSARMIGLDARLGLTGPDCT